MLAEVLEALDPRPGETVLDCTLGFAGHAAAMLERIGTGGRFIGMDWDLENVTRARQVLEATSLPYAIHHGNFAGAAAVLVAEHLSGVDVVLADLGMSSMQVDDPDRGFSYMRDGPLDMRMDRSRGQTAAQLLSQISETDLARALADLGDEPDSERIAAALVAARRKSPLATTSEVSRVIAAAVDKPTEGRWRLHPAKGQWKSHPAARTFQALRILVNRELANLEHLLRILPQILRPGGRAAIISFHSGEDRLVKAAFRAGLKAGHYRETAVAPVRASLAEKLANPRSRSAKLRWARRVV
jgi:16S rRNA (cytosine1402-N4)-methyltransferase